MFLFFHSGLFGLPVYTGFMYRRTPPHKHTSGCVCVCAWLCIWKIFLYVYMYSMWGFLKPQQGFGLPSQMRTLIRSSDVSWLHRSPGACWDGSLHVAGHVWSGGRSSWSTCHTVDSWSASPPCVYDSDASARLNGRTFCHSQARCTRRAAHQCAPLGGLWDGTTCRTSSHSLWKDSSASSRDTRLAFRPPPSCSGSVWEPPSPSGRPSHRRSTGNSPAPPSPPSRRRTCRLPLFQRWWGCIYSGPIKS